MAKVKYGLCNVYYSKITETYSAVNNQYTYEYATPVAIPGAVNLSLEAQGETSTFRADNTDYFITTSNNGYEGDLEIALVPDSFKKDILGMEEDANGLLYETNQQKASAFALMFQFESDTKARRHVFYNCKATRPGVASQTTEETIEPVTETISITATGRLGDGLVKASSQLEDNTSQQYSNWFTAVQLPAEQTGE